MRFRGLPKTTSVLPRRKAKIPIGSARPGPKIISLAQDYRGQARSPGKRTHQAVRGNLRLRIGIAQIRLAVEGCVLIDTRTFCDRTVDRQRAGIDELSDALLFAGGQHPLSSGDVGLEVVLERRGPNLGGEMIDDVGSLDSVGDGLGIAQIAANDLDAGGLQCVGARRRTRQHAHRRALREQVANQKSTQKACAAGYADAHD